MFEEGTATCSQRVSTSWRMYPVSFRLK